ncbi:MAG: tetratricopeptide repeat protein, partial [Thermoanaerobaculia bacterium]
MRHRLIAAFVLASALAATGVRADQVPPREIWPQATAAATAGDIDSAIKRTNELLDTGRSYGIRNFPSYAVSSAAISRQADKQGQKALTDWGRKTADQLDPASPAVAFLNSDHQADHRDWAQAISSAMAGFGRMFARYRTSLLSRNDLLVVAISATAIAAAVFSLLMFIRYFRSMGHDFRETLGRRIHGGSVSVLAFALLFLPIFIWLGPIWLVFYWFVIFFGYANKVERAGIIVMTVLLAILPMLLDHTATRISGVDGTVVMAAIVSDTQSYQPEALRRVEELASIVPDSPIIHLLLGNLYLHEGNEQQAEVHYRRSMELKDSAGAHVNIGNLHFLDNDFAAANTEYEKAQKLDSHLAIAFYNASVASGEMYRFDQQGQKLEMAKKIDRSYVERLAQSPPPQKIVIFRPDIDDAWEVQSAIAKRGVARSSFGNYAYFDPTTSAPNPVTIGGTLALILALVVWFRRRSSGFAGSCIKCGRTFCHRCKSARESSTYCTQCIHIYLKRDGVALATKRTKLEEVHDHLTSLQRRNRLFATLLPGSAQVLEGRTVVGLIGMVAFLFFVCEALLVGRLAPALAPVAHTAQLVVRSLAIVLAVITWF